jgi:hypothetical protein
MCTPFRVYVLEEGEEVEEELQMVVAVVVVEH